jgi:signal transduction histidine kinase
MLIFPSFHLRPLTMSDLLITADQQPNQPPAESLSSPKSSQLFGIARYRWLFIATLAVLGVGFEIYEHWVLQNTLDSSFFRESFLFVVYPIILGLLFELMNRAEQNRINLAIALNLQNDLNRHLAEAESWDTLIDTIVRFSRFAVPAKSAVLFVHDRQLQEYTQVATWPEQMERATENNSPPRFCDVCPASIPGNSVATAKQSSISNRPSTVCRNCNSLCIPLRSSEAAVGILMLSLDPDTPPQPYQMSIMSQLATTMGPAIDSFRPRRLAKLKAKAVQEERQRIGIQLHDTLAQDIAILRLRLDAVASEVSHQSRSRILQEIKEIHDLANQAYEQVRGTLVDLRSAGFSRLEHAIVNEGRALSRDSNFTIKHTSTGQPVHLTDEVDRNIFYIAREALINIRKHAKAKEVTIDFVWTQSHLTMQIKDDGIGFDVQDVKPLDRHFGIGIMHERAAAVYGSLELISHPGGGTTLTLRVPLENAIASSSSPST